MESKTEYSDHINKNHVVGFQTQINRIKNQYKVVISMSNGESHSKSFDNIDNINDFVKGFESVLLSKW